MTWSWEGHDDARLDVLELRPNEHVAFRWQAEGLEYHTRTQLSLTPRETGTRLAVTESGWDADSRGMRSAFCHCQGWTQFVDALKVYLEHDLALMRT